MQYYHMRQGIESTLCVEVPNKAWLELFFKEHGNQTILPIGLTVKAATDQFNKKLGRAAAEKKVNHIPVTFEKVFIRGTRHFYVFQGTVAHNKSKYKLTLHLSTIKESDNAFLTYSEIT